MCVYVNVYVCVSVCECVCECVCVCVMNLIITVVVCKHRCCLFKKPAQLEFDIRQHVTRTPVHTVAELLGFAKCSWTNRHKRGLHTAYRSVGGSVCLSQMLSAHSLLDHKIPVNRK